MRRLALPAISLILSVACGSSESEETPGTAGGSTAGTAGAAGGGGAGAGAAGASGVAGQAGKAGSAGTAGAAGGSGSAGKSGAAGASGTAGKSGAAGASGTAGTSGASGTGGAAGTAGSAGKAGSGGAACTTDPDCKLPTTTPADCATAKCDKGLCRFLAKDNDGDGQATAKCSAPGVSVEVGTDCDDNDKNTYKGAWDGPASGGSQDRCDGIDNDCNGTKDDALLPSGQSCTCAPGDVASCSEDSGGKPITFPGGSPQGLCKKGSKTCGAQGTWSPCTGTVAPQPESCDGLDNDCNGKVDDNPLDGIYFVYDGDDDLRGAKGCPKVFACKDKPPVDPPKGCGVDTCTTCTGGWKFATAIPADDCDDTDAAVNPLAKELCGDAKDSDCDGAPNNGCPCVDGQTQPCWDGAVDAVFGDDPLYPKSLCKRGTQTCDLSGKWGSCSGQVFPKSETCSGADENCNGVVDEGFDVGATCNVKGSSSGTCLNAGAWACDAGGGKTCVSGTPGVGDAVFHDTAGPNASFDWSCDGGVTKEATDTNWVLLKGPSGPSCVVTTGSRCTSSTSQAQCLGYPKTESRPRAYFCGDEIFPACGAKYTKYTCVWDAATSKCLNGTTEDFVQRCY